MGVTWNKIRSPLAAVGRRILYRPLGLKRIGQFSGVHLPRRVEGARYIEIGCRVYVRSYSTLLAISRHETDSYRPSIVIGDDVYIGRFVYLGAIDSINIGSGSVLSEHVYITDLSHGFDPNAGAIMNQRLVSKGPVKIGAHCFLGYRVAVMPGVVLGDHCVVGTNSVVTRSFPSYSMIGGVPARLLRRYSFESKDWRLISELELKWQDSAMK
jgi:acetyltransferase-like isoleucine patch superfamily enzyme